MDITIKKPKTIHAGKVMIGGCFKLEGDPQTIYMRIPTIGINLPDGRDVAYVNLHTGEIKGLYSAGHDVIPVKARVVEE